MGNQSVLPIPKTNKQPHKNFTEVNNLITNAPLSWTPSTADKAVNPNHTVSLDWGIVHKRNKTGHKNVFALFLDLNTGLVFVYPAETRGQAGEALKAYITRYGKPQNLLRGNLRQYAKTTGSTKPEALRLNPTKTRLNSTWIYSCL